MDFVLPGIFLLIWGTFMLGMVGGMVAGLAALVSAAKIPPEAFGPWWDNTKTAWLLGIAISFMVPFGMLIAGIYWFRTGRPHYTSNGIVGRPFWTGPPKPPPPPPPPGWS